MSYLHLTSPELRGYVERARQERAEVVARMLRRAARVVSALVQGAARTAVDPGRRAAARIARWRRRRAALSELSSLDERVLKDIGLSPGDVFQIAERYGETGQSVVRTRDGLLPARSRMSEPAGVEAGGAGRTVRTLKAPLTSIRRHSEIVRDNPDLPAAEREAHLGVVLSESERLDRAIDRVLDDRDAA